MKTFKSISKRSNKKSKKIRKNKKALVPIQLNLHVYARIGRPSERFVGEDDAVRATAQKYGVSFDGVKRALHLQAYQEAERMRSDQETPEYEEWRKKNEELFEKASVLLEEFYEGREVPDRVRLVLQQSGEGNFDLSSAGIEPAFEELSEE